MTEPTLILQKTLQGYKLDQKKLKHASQNILPYLLGSVYYHEDYEYFDKIRPYLDIPEEPKSLEDIQKEYDEKYEERVKSIKLKFEVLQNRLERNIDLKFDLINKKFDYAKKHGHFQPNLYTETFNSSYLIYDKDGMQWSNVVPNTVEIRPSANPVGYWSIKPNIEIWLDKTPNPIVRFFTKLLLDFTWNPK